MYSPIKLAAYDIIICGGGTAGCVLATRLSENPDIEVLLLEAGYDASHDARVSTPGLSSALLDDPSRDWMFLSEPNPGLKGRKMAHPRGKCIGGSAATNRMALLYPSKTGLDTWAELGNPGWDFASMVPYFQKFQTHIAPSPEVQEALGIDYLGKELTGTSGPIAASFPLEVNPMHKAWIDTWKGLKQKGNPFDGVSYGGFVTPSAVVSGRRSHAASDYLEPAKNRPNLHVVQGVLVERVRLDSTSSEKAKATAVELSWGVTKLVAHAKREVVLCAGSFGSPQILELSGIGDSKMLQSLGIESCIDNKNVGEGLQDHLMCGPSYEVKDGVETIDILARDQDRMKAAMDEYHANRSGPLSVGGGFCSAYTPLVDFITPNPKHELTALLDQHLNTSTTPKFPAETLHYAFNRRIIESPHETSAAMNFGMAQQHLHRLRAREKFQPTENANFVTILTQMSHPFSRGSVHIVSADANVKPSIKTNYLAHPLDAEILGRHLLQCEALAQSEPFKSFLKPGGIRLPRENSLATLEDAVEFGRAHASTQYHPCGTCAMMPVELGGVVDERLVVHGTANLRVVDASVFPIEPRGNIMTTVYATAEKGADLIKQDMGL